MYRVVYNNLRTIPFIFNTFTILLNLAVSIMYTFDNMELKYGSLLLTLEQLTVAFFPSGAVAFRMLRIIRIFRLFRINAYYDSLNVITEVIVGKKQQLLSSVFIILILMISSSLCMYSLENKAQPEVFTNAFSGIWRFDGRRYLTIQMRSDISFLYNLLIDVLLIYMLQSVSVNNDSVFFMFTTILISKT